MSSPFGRTPRRHWTHEERTVVFKYFGVPTKFVKLPSLQKCQEIINKCLELECRKPQQLKTWLDNQRKAKSRKQAKCRQS